MSLSGRYNEKLIVILSMFFFCGNYLFAFKKNVAAKTKNTLLIGDKLFATAINHAQIKALFYMTVT